MNRSISARETAWALLLLKEAEDVQERAAFYPLPTGLAPVLASKAWSGTIFFGRGEWVTTAQTTLDWSWLPDEGPSVAGTLTWPNSSNGVEEHAAGLLEVAEGTLLEGCPPSPPPAVDLVRRRIRVNHHDAVRGMDEQLVERFRNWRPDPPCDPRQLRPKAK